ncbi:MAG: SixA phosphatase family protein [Chitinophagaceae bacterium]
MTCFDVYKILELCASSDEFFIFIRHAEKDRAVKVDDAVVPLTTNGIKETHQLAEFLSLNFPQISLIKTSPLLRCSHTAKILADHYPNNEVPIVSSTLLGNPGAFVADDQLTAKVFDQFSVYEVVQQQLMNKPLPGFHSIQVGVERLYQDIVSTRLLPGRPAICISHDVVLAAFAGYFLQDQIKLSEHLWLNYLEGFVVKRDKSKHYIQTTDHSIECQLKRPFYG